MAAICVALGAMAGCANTSGGRSQLVTPSGLAPLSAAYSEVDLKLKLLLEPERVCAAAGCPQHSDLEQRSRAIGRRLAMVAYGRDHELVERVPAFVFEVIDKAEPGSASSSAGRIVVHQGIEKLGFTDAELAFVLAREIAHVTERHHDENVASSLIVSVLAQIFLPILQVANGAAALVSANTAQNAAIATAASAVGSKVLKASYRPVQLQEADATALALLRESGWDCRRLADSLELFATRKLDRGNDWERELADSTTRLASSLQGPPYLPATLALGDGEMPATPPPPMASGPLAAVSRNYSATSTPF